MCNTGPWHWGTGAMAPRVCVVLSAAEREQLAAIAADRNRPRKHIERAQIVLASADRHPAQQVAQSIGVSRPTVWRWQQRFAESGIDGLLPLRHADLRSRHPGVNGYPCNPIYTPFCYTLCSPFGHQQFLFHSERQQSRGLFNSLDRIIARPFYIHAIFPATCNGVYGSVTLFYPRPRPYSLVFSEA